MVHAQDLHVFGAAGPLTERSADRELLTPYGIMGSTDQPWHHKRQAERPLCGAG
jgi:hypothetical protein